MEAAVALSDVHAGGNITISGVNVSQVIQNGPTPDQLQQLTQAAAAGVTGVLLQQVGALSAKLGITENAVVAFLRTLGEQAVPTDQLTAKLAEVATRYNQAVARAAALDPQDPATRTLVAQAQAAIGDGRFADADRMLDEAEQIEVAAARQAQDVARQAVAAADERLIRAADARGVRGELAMTGLRYTEAAAHFGAAAALVPAGRSDLLAAWLKRQADALRDQGERRGEGAALDEAIGLYQRVLAMRPRESAPSDWAAAQNNLGNALRIRGEREAGTGSLVQAVEAFTLASQEHTRERFPLKWAGVQSNLGTALTLLAARERDATRLDTAIAAYGAALDVWTRESAPRDWAAAQSNLGNALQELGKLREDPALLHQSVAAYEAALQVWTQERTPGLWATAENNLGNTLKLLAWQEPQDADASLAKAAAAHRAALQGWPRERFPVFWAEAEYNLGNALLMLSAKTRDAAMLAEAKLSFQGAMEVAASVAHKRLLADARKGVTDAGWLASLLPAPT
jgi:tetratricopeptide (TPR) repeat protein